VSKFNKLVLPELRVRRSFQHLHVVNTKDVVTAQAPSGIHTQVKDGNWENYARLMAAGSHALRELKSMIEPCEAAGFDMSRAREILQKLEDEQKPYVEEFATLTAEDYLAEYSPRP
jgi:hypothetical protein